MDSTIFWVLFCGYFVWMILMLNMFFWSDYFNEDKATNCFDQIWISFVPAINFIAVCMVFYWSVAPYAYKLYCEITGTRNLKLEKKNKEFHEIFKEGE